MKLGKRITAAVSVAGLSVAATAAPALAAFGTGDWERPNSFLCNWWSFLC